ncbi:MAG TPA: efflux RND transporter periplasmic adaptor subunit [Terriglobia bacterium]|jgi:RND family efflux transporter MFP subunit|nr:efflux RND transporter periplasmic adaptor subunit [Terriglobia bacterium]
MKTTDSYEPDALTELEPSSPELTPPRRRWGLVVALLLVGLAVAAAVIFGGILPKLKAREQLRVQTDQLAVPTVSVISMKPSNAQQEVVLPANIQPYISAPIFARTNGYLKSWTSDIGAHVKKGQLLAEIETPEVDAQLRQAQADLATAQANLHLSEVTAARYQDLLKSDSVSKQDTDNATSDLAAKQTTLQSGEANVKRLQDLQSFEKIYAPFDGVITARNTDIGQLINSGSGAPVALFQIAAVDVLRVYVNVPQIYSNSARRGMTVDLTLPQFPGKRFQGTLVRTADAIDQASRTLLVEVDVKNPSGELLSGAYAETHFKLPPVSGHTFLIPVPALIFRSEGAQVATVDDGHHAVLKPVTLGRDFGTQIEVITGLTGDDQVIVNPPDSLIADEEVRPVPARDGGGSR